VLFDPKALKIYRDSAYHSPSIYGWGVMPKQIQTPEFHQVGRLHRQLNENQGGNHAILQPSVTVMQPASNMDTDSLYRG
jgi:hypothetical protein